MIFFSRYYYVSMILFDILFSSMNLLIFLHTTWSPILFIKLRHVPRTETIYTLHFILKPTKIILFVNIFISICRSNTRHINFTDYFSLQSFHEPCTISNFFSTTTNVSRRHEQLIFCVIITCN